MTIFIWIEHSRDVPLRFVFESLFVTQRLSKRPLLEEIRSASPFGLPPNVTNGIGSRSADTPTFLLPSSETMSLFKYSLHVYVDSETLAHREFTWIVQNAAGTGLRLLAQRSRAFAFLVPLPLPSESRLLSLADAYVVLLAVSQRLTALFDRRWPEESQISKRPRL
jgi:hypothetical protein